MLLSKLHLDTGNPDEAAKDLLKAKQLQGKMLSRSPTEVGNPSGEKKLASRLTFFDRKILLNSLNLVFAVSLRNFIAQKGSICERLTFTKKPSKSITRISKACFRWLKFITPLERHNSVISNAKQF